MNAAFPCTRIVFALVLAAAACRSGVAPPETDAFAPPREPLPPGLLDRQECPRRECPPPADVMANLEQRIGARLDLEAAAAADGLDALDAQRDALERAVAEVVARRRSGETAGPAAPAGGSQADGGPPAAGTPDEAGALIAGETSRDATAFFERLLPLALPEARGVVSAPTSAPSESPDAPSGRAPAARAQVAGPRDGRWILPILRATSRLRDRFEAVSTAVSDLRSLEGGLRRAETALRLVRDRWAVCSVPDVPESPAAASGVRDAGSHDSFARAILAARADACKAAEADAGRLLDALDDSRPAGCAAIDGSSVCHPPEIERWSTDEIDRLDDSDPANARRVIELLDGLLEPPPGATSDAGVEGSDVSP